jgi:hypothetical protein
LVVKIEKLSLDMETAASEIVAFLVAPEDGKKGDTNFDKV